MTRLRRGCDLADPVDATVVYDGYRRPTAFDVKIGDKKIKGKLITE